MNNILVLHSKINIRLNVLLQFCCHSLNIAMMAHFIDKNILLDYALLSEGIRHVFIFIYSIFLLYYHFRHYNFNGYTITILHNINNIYIQFNEY